MPRVPRSARYYGGGSSGVAHRVHTSFRQTPVSTSKKRKCSNNSVLLYFFLRSAYHVRIDNFISISGWLGKTGCMIEYHKQIVCFEMVSPTVSN